MEPLVKICRATIYRMIYCVGDLHLDALNRYVPSARDAILATLERIYTSAKREGVEHVVLLGDIFDSAYPTQSDQIALIRLLRQHRQLTTHVLMGNHDFADKKHHALRTLAWLCKSGFLTGKVYLRPEIVELDGANYFFCPHPYITDQPANVRYSFGHFGYNGARGDSGIALRSRHEPRGRWILGDYHTAQRGRNYMYAGALCQVKFYEKPKRYYIEIDEVAKFVQIEPQLKLARITFADESDLAMLRTDTYYSAHIPREHSLPPNWNLQHSNVVHQHVKNAGSKRQQILMQSVASEDPLEGLSDALINDGLNDKQVQRAYELLGR